MKEKRNLLIAALLSGILGWAFGFLRLPYLKQNFSFGLGFLAGLSLLALVLLFFFVWNKNFLLHHFLGKNIADHSSTNTSQSFSKTHFLTWFLIALFIFVGGLLSSFLIHQQHQFFKTQTHLQQEKLTQQSALMESTRKSNALVLMNGLFDKMDAELENSSTRVLSEETIARLAALNYSFEPYHYLEADTLSAKKLSPERGQLLLVLLTLDLDTSSFNLIKKTTSFLGADLRDANLVGADLNGIDLRDANLNDAILEGANLQKADLSNANLWGASLEKANLTATILKQADLSWANLAEANLGQAQLVGANLSAAKLRGADLNSADLSSAILENAILVQADLTLANFKEANLRKANLEQAIFEETNFSLADLSYSNLNQTELEKANLDRMCVEDMEWFQNLAGWKIKNPNTYQDSFKIVIDYTQQCDFRVVKK